MDWVDANYGAMDFETWVSSPSTRFSRALRPERVLADITGLDRSPA